MKKKLLIFHPIIAPYRIDMINALAVNFEVTLCLYANNLQGQKFDIHHLYDERMNVQPEFLLDKKYNGKTNVRKAMVNAIKVHEPDVVMVSEYNIYVWIVLLYRLVHRARFKVVSLVDDCIDMIEHVRSVFIWHTIARMITVPFLDQLIIVDKRAVEWYQRKYEKGVFFPIVSDDIIYRERLQRILPISEEYVRQYNLEGKKILLFVGRLSSEKNISMAIDAFLQAKLSDCVFVIIGDGPEKDMLCRKYGNEDSVMLLGRYEGDPLYAWYNVAQVLILPSIRETFGAVTNEALMAGCQVILSEVAGSGCLIDENKNGYFVSPSDKDGISNQITRALAVALPINLPIQVKVDLMSKTFREYISELVNSI